MLRFPFVLLRFFHLSPRKRSLAELGPDSPRGEKIPFQRGNGQHLSALTNISASAAEALAAHCSEPHPVVDDDALVRRCENESNQNKQSI